MRNYSLLSVITVLSLFLTGCNSNEMCLDTAGGRIVAHNGHALHMLYFRDDGSMELYQVKKKSGVEKVTEISLTRIDTSLFMITRLGVNKEVLTSLPFEPNSRWTVSNSTYGDAADFSFDFIVDDEGLIRANEVCD